MNADLCPTVDGYSPTLLTPYPPFWAPRTSPLLLFCLTTSALESFFSARDSI